MTHPDRVLRFAALLASATLSPLLLLAQPEAQPPQAEPAADAVPEAPAFTLTLDPAVHSGAFSGRVYLVLATGKSREPRQAMGDWFGKTQFIALDVASAKPGSPIALDQATLGWPKAPKDIPAGEYTVQAVARVNPDNPDAGRGAGDLYSQPVRVRFDRSSKAPARALTLSGVVKEREFHETARVKLFEMKSPSLSAFLKRDRTIRAGVVLPKGWEDNPAKKYPTLYWIGGFGSDHSSAAGIARLFGDECLIVVPDPSCFRGHSVFADSENNGPWGRALIEDLIPAVEAKYRGSGDASRRYVSGMSSGGWSSLWLQVAYPDSFAGCWSHCPDPVDFHDFQRVDLYEPGSNIYKDAQGQRRPVARQGDTPSLYFDDFIAQETVMGPGGQIHSFEAVFSPRAPDGTPRPVFDRTTGAVDTAVGRTWEKYDIRLKLEREWPVIGPKLKGKLHIFAGEKDTFYLDGAARRLKESLAKLGSDAVVEIVPGMPHTIHRPAVKAMVEAISGRPEPDAER